MIDIRYKIHDNFSVEFKVGFVPQNKENQNNFKINTWIFIPNSLGINNLSYKKEQFYRDVKSNVRLITPIFRLNEIVGKTSMPINTLKKALSDFVKEQSPQNEVEYEHQIKIFIAIVKSSLRNNIIEIETTDSKTEIEDKIIFYAENIKQITTQYRNCKQMIENSEIDGKFKDYFYFGDEYLSHIISLYTFRILNKIKKSDNKNLNPERDITIKIISNENEHKKKCGYIMADKNNPQKNIELVFRHGLLKKFIESDLYIKLNKRRDGYAVEQIYYSIAAGMAMLFATIVAFAFKYKFGAVSVPLFFALIVSYMLKDRIKELMRYYFAHKLGDKYFDYKAKINISNETVGWIKEGVDFITDDKVPAIIMDLRNRTSALQAENRIFDEKIILYRKYVYINGEKLSAHNKYKTGGINDVLRFHVNNLLQKMDNPDIDLKKVNENNEIEIIKTKKSYYINILMQFIYDDQLEYRRFRVLLTRDGILEIQDI